MSRYLQYSNYLKDKYGVKTYKIPINLPLSCPNRDGNLAYGGCSYCGSQGASFEDAKEVDIKEKVLQMKEGIARKYKAKKFIVYFQNFTNTYLPLKQLLDNIKSVLGIEDIVEISLATRPDCINEKYVAEIMELINQAEQEIKLSFELGLQTTNYHTLADINRGHSLAEFIDAVLTAQKFGAEVGTHLILNLPGDNLVDAREAAKIVSSLKIDTIKLHALYIREDTQLAKDYQAGSLEMISLEEYIKRVIEFLQYLDPEIAVQRLLGKAPQEKTLFVNWGYNYSEVNNLILAKMEEKDIKQGDKFDYLQGKALTKFSGKE